MFNPRPLCVLLILIFLQSATCSLLFAEDTILPEKEAYTEKSRKLQYDPYAGIDRDGRIPKVELPDDIKNPERWRYIPEGKIKPGNLFQRFLVSSFIVPLFFHEKDIGTGAGVAITDVDFRQQRRREFAGIFLSYTTEGQQRYSLLWQRWLHHRDLATGGVALEERSYIRGRIGYEKTLTRRFFGFGPDTEADDETSYTEEIGWTYLLVQQSVPGPGDDIVYELSIKGEKHNLDEGRVSGVPSTDEEYPVLFEKGDDYDILWLDGYLRYDTRDSQHIPYSGWMLEGGADVAPLQSNEDTAAIFTVNSSGVLKVPGLFHDSGDKDEEHPPTDTVAIGAMVQWTEGKLPYWAMPSLGGRNTLRGYIRNRFTGRALWHASAEYRFWTVPRGIRITDTVRVERLGAAAFYDIGTVSDDLDDLWSATVHDSYGFSLRFIMDRTAMFRADIGFSDEDTVFTFAYGLSF
jgi:outer membrane protein assembly factor BamA